MESRSDRPRATFEPASGWAGAMGLDFIEMSKDRVVVEWTVDSCHRQPHGIVHGGVHCGVVETVCSVGAALNAAEVGQVVVGVENHTSFLRPVRQGRLRAIGVPLHRGRQAQLWEARIEDQEGKLVATGRVRLFAVAAPSADGAAAAAG